MKIDNNKNGICVFDFVSFRLTISCRWDSVEPVREEGFRNPPPVILPNPTGYCVLQGARKQGRKEEGFCNPVTGGFAEPDGGLRASRGKEAGKEEGFCNPITGGFAKPDGELRASRGKEAGKEEGFCNPITGGFAEPDGGLRVSRGERRRETKQITTASANQMARNCAEGEITRRPHVTPSIPRVARNIQPFWE